MKIKTCERTRCFAVSAGRYPQQRIRYRDERTYQSPIPTPAQFHCFPACSFQDGICAKESDSTRMVWALRLQAAHSAERRAHRSKQHRRYESAFEAFLRFLGVMSVSWENGLAGGHLSTKEGRLPRLAPSALILVLPSAHICHRCLRATALQTAWREATAFTAGPELPSMQNPLSLLAESSRMDS